VDIYVLFTTLNTGWISLILGTGRHGMFCVEFEPEIPMFERSKMSFS